MNANKPYDTRHLSYAAVGVKTVKSETVFDDDEGYAFILHRDLNANEPVDCEECEGTGEDPRADDTCEGCDGTGSGDQEDGTCEDCDGSGMDEEAETDCPQCGGTGEYDPDEGDHSRWEPMVNYAWPAPGLVIPSDWRDRLHGMTILQDSNGDAYFAQTGWGMDWSWYIAETFVAFGFYPPADLRLPRFCGRGTSAKDKSIIEAMRESLKCQKGWTESALEDLDRMESWAAEFEAKREAQKGKEA